MITTTADSTIAVTQLAFRLEDLFGKSGSGLHLDDLF